MEESFSQEPNVLMLANAILEELGHNIQLEDEDYLYR